MGTSGVLRGAVAERVRANIKRIRVDRKLTGAQLSELLGALGRPMLPTAVNKIETGARRVDVDDLATIALALNTTPNRLMLDDPFDRNVELELAPAVTAQGFQAWAWANGQQVLLASGEPLGWGDAAFGEVQRDFLRHAQAPALHPAQDAADDIRGRIGAFLSWVDEYARETQRNAKQGREEHVPVDELIIHAEAMRQSLRRLQTQIGQLLDDSPLANQPEYGSAFFASVEVHEQAASRVLAARERASQALKAYMVDEARAHEARQMQHAANVDLEAAMGSGDTKAITDMHLRKAELHHQAEQAMSAQIHAHQLTSEAESALAKAEHELYEMRRLMLIRNMVPPQLPTSLAYIDSKHPTEELATQVGQLWKRLNEMRMLDSLAAVSTPLPPAER